MVACPDPSKCLWCPRVCDLLLTLKSEQMAGYGSPSAQDSFQRDAPHRRHRHFARLHQLRLLGRLQRLLRWMVSLLATQNRPS